MLRLLMLLAAAVFPLALSVCLGAVLRAEAHAGCHLGYPTSRLLGGGFYLLALLLALRITWAAVMRARAARRAVPTGALAAVAKRMSLGGGHELLVLPIADPVAYTAGLARARVIVSRGLLNQLDRDERHALLAHELAHAEAGHQRMLFLGQVVVDALGFLPPVRRAFQSLRRQIELAADASAVEAVGEPRVLARAIAKAALAAPPVGVAAAAGEPDLRERLERLMGATPAPSPLATTGTASGVAAVASALVLSVCLAAHAGDAIGNTIACLSVLAVLLLPPLLHGRANHRRLARG